MLKKISTLVLLLSLLIVVAACRNGDRDKTTTIEIEDPVRHYYPILQGEKQKVLVKITNSGENVLHISSILPSCGCTVVGKYSSKVAPGGYTLLDMEYNSNKNIGYVEIYTTIIANTKRGSETFKFDINVAPDPHYTKDYEELYKIQMTEENGNIEARVDGAANQRGYEIDSLEIHRFKKMFK